MTDTGDFSSPRPRSPWRRRFLIAAGVTGGALAIGLWRFARDRDHLTAPPMLTSDPGSLVLNAWIRLGHDGSVVVQVPRQEMGQGITTALPMLVAEEMDADFANVRFEQAPVHEIYANATMIGDGVPFRPDDDGWLARTMRGTQFRIGEILGVQATGGSTSVRDAWAPMRRAGATARAMLVSAAAARFGVPASECTVAAGVVSHAASGKQATFGALAADAAKQRLPADVKLKSPAQFALLGQSPRRLDLPAKVDGTAQFGLDVRLPGLKYAAIVQAPVFGGRVKSLDTGKASARKGVVAAFAIDATGASEAAVVVVADHYWQARSALADLVVVWDDGPNAGFDSAEQRRRHDALLSSGEARVYDERGNVENGFAAPPRPIDASYHAPYLAHAAMEPINCTAVARSDRTCEVWVGNQAPTLVKWYAAKAADVPSENVTVHTPYLGGGFGRRAEVDVVMQAVAVAKHLTGTPVQLIWSREEDMRHDRYRPAAAARLRAAIDTAGNVTAWSARIVSQSCTANFTARLVPAAASDAMKDRTTTEGVFDLPYAFEHRRIEHVLTHEPVPVGFWRSVGHSHNAFFAESFMDECAFAAKADPLAFRLALLRDAPRHRKVLETVAVKAGWHSPLPAGIGRGIALAESFHSIVAQVAEVEVKDGRPIVRRIVCAIDCGIAVHPDTVVAQMESGIVFGLGAALFGEITLKAGRVEQGNYTDYPLPTLADTPRIEVHIVDSGVEHLGGVGEPGTPPVAPAVCNAIFAATGKRVRDLPIRL
ncbi:MAG: xanthine dehydrogenase family protein molybdopterin-binding subunit [Burkholderiales bacterium]